MDSEGRPDPQFAIKGTGRVYDVSRRGNYAKEFSNYPKVGPQWNGDGQRLLEDARMLADDLEDGTTGYRVKTRASLGVCFGSEAAKRQIPLPARPPLPFGDTA